MSFEAKWMQPNSHIKEIKSLSERQNNMLLFMFLLTPRYTKIMYRKVEVKLSRGTKGIKGRVRGER